MDEQDIELLAASAANIFLLLSRNMLAETMIYRITATHGLQVSIVTLDDDMREKEH